MALSRAEKTAYARKWRADNPDKVREARERFHANKPGYRSRWVAANPESGKAWKAKNRDKVAAINGGWVARNRETVARSARTRLGLPPEIRPMPDRCEICAGPPGRGWTLLAFDHVHDETKAHRGWLCCSCNLMLGNSKDRPDILRAGAAYLDKFNAERTQR